MRGHRGIEKRNELYCTTKPKATNGRSQKCLVFQTDQSRGPLVQPSSCTYYAISTFPLHNSSNTLWPIESVCQKEVIPVTYTVQTVVCKGHQISSALTPFPHMMCAIWCRVLLQCIVGPRGAKFPLTSVGGGSISSTMCPLRGEEFPVEPPPLVPGSGYHQHLDLDHSQNTCIEINEDETLAE